MKDEQKSKKELIAEIKEMRSLVMNLSEVQDVVVNERRKSQEKQLQFLQNGIPWSFRSFRKEPEVQYCKTAQG